MKLSGNHSVGPRSAENSSFSIASLGYIVGLQEIPLIRS